MERFGERRAGPRFDIVGLLQGTVESRQRHKLRNVGSHGALLDSARPFPAGMRLSGHFSDRRLPHPIRAEVRWVTSRTDHEGGPRYLVGVAWLDAPIAVGTAAPAAQPVAEAQSGPEGRERRASPRESCPDESEFEVAVSTTVTVTDVSAHGVCFSSPTPAETGALGRLSMHAGGVDFAGDIEVRRSVKHEGSKPDWGVGARFLSLSDRSRHSLETLMQRKI